MVEDMLAYRGIFVTYKTVYEWAEKFGRAYASNIRRRTPRLGDKWHLDECVISIKSEHHIILWRAVDQDGFVLDVLVQKRRNTKAAKRFMHPQHCGRGVNPPFFALAIQQIAVEIRTSKPACAFQADIPGADSFRTRIPRSSLRACPILHLSDVDVESASTGAVTSQ